MHRYKVTMTTPDHIVVFGDRVVTRIVSAYSAADALIMCGKGGKYEYDANGPTILYSVECLPDKES